MITYSGSSGSNPIRSIAARIAIAPSSVASLSASPPPSFPNGVRTAETMTERVTRRQGIASRIGSVRPLTHRPGRSRLGSDVTPDLRTWWAWRRRAGREPAPELRPQHNPLRSSPSPRRVFFACP